MSSSITEASYREQFGDDYVEMNKETAIIVMREYSDYEDREGVIRTIKGTTLKPYMYVPPLAYLKYRESITNKTT